MSDLVVVGMADLNICKSPQGITTLGLGSCVGVALRDPITKVGGLAHVMLPDSNSIRLNSNTAKFADTAIVELVSQMAKAGAQPGRLEAKIAGGAKMFSIQSKNELMRIGDRNVDACRKKLDELKIPILSEDVGASYGRTVVFFPETGEFKIRSANRDERII